MIFEGLSPFGGDVTVSLHSTPYPRIGPTLDDYDPEAVTVFDASDLAWSFSGREIESGAPDGTITF